MGKLLSGSIGAFMALAGPLIFVAVGAWAIWTYDHSFRGWRVGIGIPFTKCCFVGIPAGIGPANEKEISGLKQQLQLANENVQVLQAAINGQNASIEELNRRGEELRGELAGAQKEALGALTLAKTRASIIDRPIPGGDTCYRYQVADDNFMEALKK